jgi:hypothetical protein
MDMQLIGTTFAIGDEESRQLQLCPSCITSFLEWIRDEQK